MKKRVLSLFLVFALSISMMPATAFAEGTGTVTEQEAQSSEDAAGVSDDSNAGEDISGGNAVNKDAAVEAVQAAELDMARYEKICAALSGAVAVQADHTDHPICGATCNHEDENGSSTHEDVTWTAINTADDLPSYKVTSGYYYLTNNITLTDTWSINSGQNIVLCLNGHSITMNKNTSVITIDYSTFTLCDCTANGEITHGTDGGTKFTGSGVCVGSGTFNMYGGKITGNTSTTSSGGGVSVSQGGKFSMYGGEISGNTSSGDGGGVSLASAGSFSMYGGEISGNTSSSSNEGGGGVHVGAGTSFTMEGGTISGNYATNGAGGGVYVETYGSGSTGTFLMKDGTITDNTATKGGGVYVYPGSTFTMEGGNITDNTADSRGGGVCVDNLSGSTTFTMKGGTITGNTVTSGNGGGVYIGSSSTLMVSGGVKITDNKSGENQNNVYFEGTNLITIAGALTGGDKSIGVTTKLTLSYQGTLTQTIATAGENYTLTDQDAACFVSDQGYFPARVNNEVQLLYTEPHVHFICGVSRGETCGHVGDAHTEELAWIGITKLDDIKNVDHANYYLLNDITLNDDTTISKNVNLCLNGKTITGGALILSNTNYTLCDCIGEGKITGSTSQNGCINLGVNRIKGSLTMYGGSISGNNTLGVYVDTGTFNMYGGEITGNHYKGVDGYAGGVYVEPEGAFYMYGNAKISGNTATFTTHKDGSGYYGAAGVYVNGGTFHMTDNAEVSNNIFTTDASLTDSSNNYAGGVYVRDGVSTVGVVTVDGKVKITGNTKDGNASNVCLPAGKTITVGDALTDGASIGVITETPIEDGDEAVVARGTDTHALTEADLEAFSSDAGIPKILRDESIIFQNGEHRHFICGEESCSDEHGDSVKWKAISSLDEIQSDGYYFLKKDVDLKNTWECKHNVQLCLNGHKITDVYGWGAITVDSGVSLDITDCQKTVGEIIQGTGRSSSYSINVQGTFTLWNGSVTKNTVSNGGVYVNGGTFTMNGGSITGNKGGEYGCGGVYVNQGSFNMNGGTITGNTSGEYGCGGVYVNEGTFTMNGGAVTGNTGGYSGGVYVAYDTTFRMTGGNITGNTHTGNTNTGSGGGGVYVAYNATFHMKGGNITGNNTTSAEDSCAGGVFVYEISTFTVSGAAQITGNWKNGTLQEQSGVYEKGNAGTASNVYLPGSKTITIEELTESAKIGVSKDKDALPEAGDEIIIATGATASPDCEKIFTLDLDKPDPYYSVIHDSDSGNVLIRRHLHNWTYSISGATITAVCDNDPAHCPEQGKGGSVTIKAPAADTLTYDGCVKEATLEGSFIDIITGVAPSITYKNEKGEEIDAPLSPGTYTASITAGDVTASVTYEIKKITPKAEDFLFTPANNLTYDGTVKTATVNVKSGISGVGEFTVEYYQGATKVEKPVNAGDYTVKIHVAEGDYYTAGDLTDDNWKFTIACYTDKPSVGLSGNMTYTGGQIKPSVVVRTLEDTLLVEDQDYTVSYGTNVDAGLFIGSVTIRAMGNYAFPEFTTNFTIYQAEQTLKFAETAVNKTYIDESFTNTFTHTKGDGKVTYSSSNTKVATVDETTGKVTITGVGTADITATAAETTNYKEGTASYTLTVEKAEIHITGVNVPAKTYDGSTKADVTKVSFADKQGRSLDGLSLGEEYTAIGAFQDANAGDNVVDIRVELDGDFAEKYVLEDKNCQTTARINAKEIRLGGATAADQSYKPGDKSVTITSVTFLDKDGKPYTMLTEGTDYTVTGEMADANIGTDKAVTVTVTLTGTAKRNFIFSGTDTTTATTTTQVTISKAPGGALAKQSFQQKFSDRKEKTFTPDYGVPAGEEWTYRISAAQTSGSAAVESDTINAATGAITYKLTDGAAGDTIRWTVTISNPNYEDFTKDLVLTLTERDPQETLRITGDNTVVYGKTMTLGTTGGSGTGKVTYSIDKDNSTGDAAIDADGVLTPVKAGSVTIIATKAGDADYEETTSAAFVITINKAGSTGEPKYTVITAEGKTLADAGLTLTGSTLNPAGGTLAWVDDKGNVLQNDTEVKANTTYQWLFTPENDNYDTLTGEVELWHVEAPAISAQPKSVSVIAGEKATFEVTATGTDVTYQWQIDRNDGKGFVDITGANSASYTTGVTDKDCDGFKYQCVISNAAGSVTTDTAVLTVKGKYTITATAGEHGSISPSGAVEVVEGSSQTFVITAEDGYEIESLTVDGKSVDAAASYTFENVAAAHTIAVTFKLQYKIIDGANSSWTQNTDGSIKIRGNGEFSKFVNVKVDGVIVDPANYKVTEGSTIIEFKPEYLKTLSEGTHTFEIAWTDGTASTSFTVAKNTSGSDDPGNNDSDDNNDDNSNNNNTAQTLTKSPKTGDASDLWIALFAVSAAGLAVMLVRRKKY